MSLPNQEERAHQSGAPPTTSFSEKDSSSSVQPTQSSTEEAQMHLKDASGPTTAAAGDAVPSQSQVNEKNNVSDGPSTIPIPTSSSHNSGLRSRTAARPQVSDSDDNTAFERSRPPSDNDKSPHNNPNSNINNASSTTSSPDGEFAGMGGTPWSQRSVWYQFRPFRGMYHDLKLRAPYYISDWTVAFRMNNLYRVVATSIRMYFVK